MGLSLKEGGPSIPPSIRLFWQKRCGEQIPDTAASRAVSSKEWGILFDGDHLGALVLFRFAARPDGEGQPRCKKIADMSTDGRQRSISAARCLAWCMVVILEKIGLGIDLPLLVALLLQHERVHDQHCSFIRALSRNTNATGGTGVRSFLKTRFTSNGNTFPVSGRDSLFYKGKGWAGGPAFAFIKKGIPSRNWKNVLI